MAITETYRLAFELSPVPLLLVDPDGVIQLANDEFCATFEYEPGAICGLAVEQLLPEPLRAHHPGLRRAFDQQPSKRQMGRGRELEGVTRTGRAIPLDLGLQPVEYEGETWVVVTAIDTSARRRAEVLAQSTLDASASAMILVNSSGHIISVNKAGLALFGYEADWLLGQSIETLLPLAVRKRHVPARKSFFGAGTTRAMGTGDPIFGRHRDGTEIQLEVALTPVEITSERLVLATIVDLSERLRAERSQAARTAAEAQATRLKHLNDELSRYAYSASHDLKAPFSTMSGMLEICIDDLRDGETDEVIENLTRLLELSRRSGQKVEAMLRMAHIGYENGNIEELALEDMAQQVWEALVIGKPSPPRLDCAIGHKRPLRSNRFAILTILENLLSNALKYRDPDKASWVRLSSTDEGDSVTVEVADNGIGIPETELEAIFGVFHRLNLQDGDGLGLSIVRRIVDSLSGQIHCQSVLGGGSKFILSLPAGDRC